MTVFIVGFVIGRVAVVANRVVFTTMCTSGHAGSGRNSVAAAPAEQRWRHGAGITSRQFKSWSCWWYPAVFGCRGEAPWLLLLSFLLLDQMAITTKLNDDMVKLSFVLWHAAIQGLKALPRVPIGHPHAMHQSEASLTG